MLYELHQSVVSFMKICRTDLSIQHRHQSFHFEDFLKLSLQCVMDPSKLALHSTALLGDSN